MKTRVVITGTGMVTPLGNTTAATWNGLLAGQSGIDFIKGFDLGEVSVRIGGEIKDFTCSHLLEKYAPGRIIERVPDCGYLLSAADQAMEEAEIPCGGDEMLCLGSGGINVLSFSEMVQLIKTYSDTDSHSSGRFIRSCLSWHPDFHYLAQEHNQPAFQLNRLLGLSSVPKDIHGACATGAQVVAAGYDLIMTGRASRVICCTMQPLDFLKYLGFYLLGALGDSDGPPAGVSRPFDRKRNGLVIAEGAAAVILEDMSTALRRNPPKIYAEVAGYGVRMDAYRLTDPHPEGIYSADTMRVALARSGVRPESVDYINAHGTSTVENDRLETKAIKQVFGDRSYDLLINAGKSMTGHTLVTAGLVETIVTALSLHEGRLHPTINLEEPDEECDLNYLAGNQQVVAPIKTAMTNSFGFGGHNISLVLKKMDS